MIFIIDKWNSPQPQSPAQSNKLPNQRKYRRQNNPEETLPKEKYKSTTKSYLHQQRSFPLKHPGNTTTPASSQPVDSNFELLKEPSLVVILLHALLKERLYDLDLVFLHVILVNFDELLKVHQQKVSFILLSEERIVGKQVAHEGVLLFFLHENF